MDWSRNGEKVRVPSLIVSGWFDDNGQGSLEAWNMNKRNNRNHARMILGPWMHKANSTRDIGKIGFGNNAIRYDIDLEFQKWFDRYLKNRDTVPEDKLGVEYYTTGRDSWDFSSTWTPEEAKPTRIYLDSGGNANSSDGDGGLKWQNDYGSNFDTYEYDPGNPAPHLIDLSDNELNIPADYSEVEKREDVLVYTSDELQEDLTVSGEIFAEIYASSSARDTDWVVRLTDVDPSGKSRRLVDGVYRAKYVNEFREETLLEDGEIRKYTINMFHASNTFKKGHRIRVQVTSGAENLVFPNQNTGRHFAEDTEYIIAKQKIHHSEAYPSHIILPVMYYQQQQSV